MRTSESSSINQLSRTAGHAGRDTSGARLHRRRLEEDTCPELLLPTPPCDDDADLEPLPQTRVTLRPTHLEDTRPSGEQPVYEAERTRVHARAPRSTPVTDFADWIRRVPDAEDPARMLSALTRLRADEAVCREALAHLRRTVPTAETAAQIFAISAAAHLRIEAARPLLLEVCGAAAERLRARDRLPEPEEHFALAAVGAIARGELFDANRIYDEYEGVVADVMRRAQTDGPLAADHLLESFATKWLDRCSAALGRPGPTARARAAAREAARHRPPVDAPPTPPRKPRFPQASVNTVAMVEPTALPSGPPPLVISAAALGCGAATLANAVLFSEVGGFFGPLSLLSLFAAVGLLGDRRWGWGAGITATFLNAAQLLVFAGGGATWVPTFAPVLGAVIALVLCFGLLTPPVRHRYERAPTWT